MTNPTEKTEANTDLLTFEGFQATREHHLHRPASGRYEYEYAQGGVFLSIHTHPLLSPVSFHTVVGDQDWLGNDLRAAEVALYVHHYLPNTGDPDDLTLQLQREYFAFCAENGYPATQSADELQAALSAIHESHIQYLGDFIRRWDEAQEEKKEEGVADYASRYGWETLGTGGGCTAYIRYLSGGQYYLLTGVEGYEAPETLDERVTVGVYTVDDEPLVVASDLGTCRVAMRLLGDETTR